MIHIPHKKLFDLKEIPVVCIDCGDKSILKPSKEQIDQLITSSYLQDYIIELKMLKKIQSIFSLFPDSMHPLKLHLEGRWKETPGVDPELEKELRKDEDLYKFMSPPSFMLLPRMKATEMGIAGCSKDLNRELIECPQCHGVLVVSRIFWLNLIDNPLIIPINENTEPINVLVDGLRPPPDFGTFCE